MCLPYMFALRKWANPRVEAYICYLKSSVDSDNPSGSVHTNMWGWTSTLTVSCHTDVTLRPPFSPRGKSTYQLHKFILFLLLVASCPRLLFAVCKIFLYLRLHCTATFTPESLLCRECCFVSLRITLI
jgi:hypothetical protein